MAKARTRGRRNAPRAVASDRRERRAATESQRRAASESQRRAATESERQSETARRPGATAGERPQGLFGPVPVSEIMILAGIVALLVGYFESSVPAIVTGAVVCVLGVTEVTAREHFSGFRSHSTLLAAIPAVVVEAAYALVIGPPAQRFLLLAPAVVVFGVCFWLLRRRFQAARHARVVGRSGSKSIDSR